MVHSRGERAGKSTGETLQSKKKSGVIEMEPWRRDRRLANGRVFIFVSIHGSHPSVSMLKFCSVMEKVPTAFLWFVESLIGLY